MWSSFRELGKGSGASAEFLCAAILLLDGSATTSRKQEAPRNPISRPAEGPGDLVMISRDWDGWQLFCTSTSGLLGVRLVWLYKDLSCSAAELSIPSNFCVCAED